MKKMLDKKLAELTGEGMSGEKAITHDVAAIEVAKRRSGKDIVLWLFALIALIAATLVNSYLPAYWQPASNVWTRIVVIAVLIISALFALALTNQGSAFKTLLLDSQVELRRVTWPSKAETTHFTWQVIVMTGLLALLVWLMDTIFGQIIRSIIG